MHPVGGLEMFLVSMPVGVGEPRLRVERLDNAHAEERFFKHRNQMSEFLFASRGVTFQALGPSTDEPARDGQQHEREQRQVLAHDQQGEQADRNHQRRLQQRLDGPDDAVLDLNQVMREATHHVAAFGLLSLIHI